MSNCLNPTLAMRSREPGANGGFGPVFRSELAEPDSRYLLPCGKCLLCKYRKGMELGVRIWHDVQAHGNEGSFITLTYDPAHCPPRLDRSHAVGFHDRADKFLRRRGKRWRGVLVGEYGERTKRPHLHAVLIGHDFTEGARQVGSGVGDFADKYESDQLAALWPYGLHDVRPMNENRAFYTALHHFKAFFDEPHLTPMRPLISRRPALGKPWLDKYKGDILKGFLAVGQQKYPVPRAYMNRADLREFLAPLREARASYMSSKPEVDVDTAERQQSSRAANFVAKRSLRGSKL